MSCENKKTPILKDKHFCHKYPANRENTDVHARVVPAELRTVDSNQNRFGLPVCLPLHLTG